MKKFFLMTICAGMILTQSGCLETFKSDAGKYAKEILLAPKPVDEWASATKEVEYFDGDLKPIKQPITVKKTATIQYPLTVVPSSTAATATTTTTETTGDDSASQLP